MAYLDKIDLAAALKALEPPPPAKRSLFAVANDTVIEAGNAVAGAAGSLANMVSPGNRFSQAADEFVRQGEQSQSDAAKQAKQQFRDDVANADGVLGELGAVGRYVTDAPLLTLAQAAGSFAIPGAAVKSAGAIGGRLSGAVGATRAAQAVAASRAGLAGGAAAGGMLAGGDAAGTAYELVIRAGGTEEEAQAAAREASLLPAAIGAAGGVIGAERILAGAGGVPKGSLMARALKTGLIEGGQEAVEEGVTQFEGQRVAVPFDPSIDPTKGVAAAAGMGFAMGAPIGGFTGGFDAYRNPSPAPRLPAPVDTGKEAARKLGEATSVADMAAAAEELAMAPLTPQRADAAMSAFEQRAADDQADIKQQGRMDRTGLPPLPPREQDPARQPSATVIDSPFGDRVLTLREQIADPQVRQTIRDQFGDEALGTVAYYATIADDVTKPMPDKTRDRLLGLAEGIVSKALLRPLNRPGVEGTTPAPAGRVGMAPRAARIGLDTGQTGRFRVDAAGNAAPETNADVIDSRQRTATRPDGFEQQVQGRPLPRDFAMVGDGTLTTPQRRERAPQPVLLLTADNQPYGSLSAATVRARKEGGEVVAMQQGGWAVRKETASDNEPDVAVPAQPVAATGDRRDLVDPRGGRVDGPVSVGPGGVGGASAAPSASGGPSAAVADGRGADGALSTLKTQWAEAVRSGDTEGAARINEQIVAAKAGQQVAAPAPAQAGAPAEDDPFAALFGTPAEQAAAQAKFTADVEAKKQRVARVRDAIAEQKRRAVAEHDEWAGKVYKQNKTQVELRGDGPSRQDSMSIGAINESRRRRAMEALAQELAALDKLSEAVSTDSGSERVLSNLSDMMAKAEKAVASGNWPNETAESMFQSMLLDDLKFRGPGGRGNVTSNGLSKAMLLALTGKDAPAEPLKARVERTRKKPAAEPARKQAPGIPMRDGRMHPKTVWGSSILALVSAKLGGLSPRVMSEFSPDRKNPLIGLKGVGRLFRDGGTSDYSEVAGLLEDYGYMEPGSVERDYKEAGETAKNMIVAALNKKEPQSLLEAEREQQADNEANRQAWEQERAAARAEAAAEEKAEREAIMAENDIVEEDWADVLNADINELDQGYSSQEYQDAILQAAIESGEEARAAEARQDASARSRAAAGAGAQAQGDEAEGADEGLTPPTEDDALRVGLGYFTQQAETLIAMPGGSWVLLDARRASYENGAFNVAFSWGNGKWSAGTTHATPKEAFDAALKLWTDHGNAKSDFKPADRTKFMSGTQGPDLLATQTEADLKAKTEREEAKRKADADEQKRLADKAKADAERDEFTLTGSNRAVDVGAAAGQGGLFDAPAPATPTPKPITPAEAGNMQRGDIVRDGSGTEFYAWSARFGRLDVMPLKDGKPVVNNASAIRFALDDATKEANPEYRTDPLYLVRSAEQAPAATPPGPKSLKDRVEATRKPAAEPEAPALDLKGFERTPKGNGAFELRDGNLLVRVEPTERGMFQAFQGSTARSGPRMTEQQAIDWAAATREESLRIQKKDAASLKERVEAKKAPAAEKANTEDSGAELTYNKRNRIKSGIKWDDIASKNDALKIKEAVKQNVYPRPDYQALVDGGMQPMVAHLVKQAYDAIAAKPNTRNAPTDADLQTYIAGVNRVMNGVLAWANDAASVAKWAAREARSAGAMLGKAVNLSDLAPGDGKTMLESVYPEGWKGNQAEVIVLGGNKLLGGLQPGYDETKRAIKAVGVGWPAAQEAWEKRGIKIVNAAKIEVSYYEGKRSRTEQPYVNIIYRVGETRLMDQLIDGVESKDDPKVQAAVAAELEANQGMFIVMDKFRRIIGKQETEEAAKDVARELTKREAKDGPDDSGIDIGLARREGVPRRLDGENISSDRLKEEFGFKGVNFGNWMKGDTPALRAERQAHLNHAFDSFADMADLFGVPAKAMSLNGMLGLAIGAQGNGKYAAHFVPGVNEINLTRTSGAGSLAHEFGHALDHYFANQAGFAKREDPFLTEHITSVNRKVIVENGRQRMVEAPEERQIRPEIVERFKAIVQAMNKKPETLEQFEARQQAAKDRAKSNVQSWLKSIKRDYVKAGVDEAAIDAIAGRIMALELGSGKIMVSPALAVDPVVDELRALYRKKAGRVPPIEQIKGLQANVDYMAYAMSERAGAVDHVPQQVTTDYAIAASALDKDKGGKRYWSTNLEKFARAFDAFVSDELEAKAAKNTYLSHAGRTGETVPMGDERATINQAIKALVDTIQTRTDDAGNVAMFSRTIQDPTGEQDGSSQEFWQRLRDGEFRRGLVASAVPGEVLARFARRRGQALDPSNAAADGREDIRFADELAGYKQFVSYAVRIADGETTGLRLHVVPIELVEQAAARGDDVNSYKWRTDASILTIGLVGSREAGYSVEVDSSRPGKLAYDNAAPGSFERTGQFDQSGEEYYRLRVGQRVIQDYLSEAVRRFGLSYGFAPDLNITRDTGANPTTEARRIDAAKVEARMSRRAGRGVPMPDAEGVAENIRRALPDAPPIIMHDTVRKAPAGLLKQIRTKGAENDVEAVYWNGEIHVFPGNIASPERMAFVVGRHEIRHHGIRTMFPSEKERNALLLRMSMDNAGLQEAAQDKLDAKLVDNRVDAVEEALADMPVEQLAKLKGFDRLVATIRKWLRGMAERLRKMDMPTLAAAIEPSQWTDNDVAAFVLKAEAISRGGAPDQGVMFSRQAEAEDGAMFSRAPTAAIRTAQDLVDTKGGVFDFNRMGESGQDRLRTVMDGSRPFWLGALTRDQIADVYGKEIPPVKEYDELTRGMENQRSKMAADADELYNEWAKLDQQDNDRLARIMLDGTVHQVHPDRPFAPIVGMDNAERLRVHGLISTQYKMLPAQAKAMYGKVRDFHLDTLTKLRDALEARIERQVENGNAKAAALTSIRKMFDKYLGSGPYFPLSRFGDYLVVANREEDGERVVASYATAGEQQTAARKLAADGFTVKMKTAKTYSRETDGAAGKFIGEVLSAVDSLDMQDGSLGGNTADLKNKLLDDINQMFIKALPDLSYRKHFMHRKGTPGFSSDVMRGFASSAFHAASHIARLNYGDRMTFALQDAFTSIENAPDGDFNLHSQVLNELTKRHDAAMNPNTHPIAAMLNQVGFVMYLGLSPAAGLVNMLQTVMVTMPHLGARYGFGKANSSLAKALTDITSGARANAKNGWNAAQSTKLTAAERAVMSELQDEGVIDLTQAHDLASATGLDTGNVARSKAAFAMSRAMKIVGWTFHIPEVMNRQVTALSAYRLEMEKSGDVNAAKDAAREAIKRTHFDYSASNRARFMSGNLARVITQFKQYSQNMTYLLVRAAHQALKGESPEVRAIARKQLVATLGVTFAMAGSMGLPGLGAAMGMLGMLAGALDDDDKPWDWKTEFRNLLADTVGQEAGEVIAHGIPRALMPWDISNRVGLGEMWWRSNDREGQNPREAFANDMQNILGPTAGTLLGLYTAADHMARGNWSKATESVVPKFLRDPLKAIRESQEGMTNYNGEPLLDVDAAEVAGRLLGFAPARGSEMFEARNAIKNAETVLNEKRQNLLSRMVKARMDLDTAEIAELQAEIQAFNQRNPEFRITMDSIMKSMRAKRRNLAETEDGVRLPRGKESLRELGRFADAT